MSKIDHAINYLASTFPGEESWQRYVLDRRAEWSERKDQDYFLVFFQNKELAIVLAWHFDKHAFTWFDSTEIPALYGFCPRDLWNRDGLGQTSLKSLLMRMPGRELSDSEPVENLQNE